MSTRSISSRSVVGVGVVKRGRPVRSKVVREVDWLSELSGGKIGLGLDVKRGEVELLVVGEGGGGGVCRAKEEKKALALAAKEEKKALALAAKEEKKALALAAQEEKKAEA